MAEHIRRDGSYNIASVLQGHCSHGILKTDDEIWEDGLDLSTFFWLGQTARTTINIAAILALRFCMHISWSSRHSSPPTSDTGSCSYHLHFSDYDRIASHCNFFPQVRYAFDDSKLVEKTAKSRGEYLRVHFKNTRETAAAVNGMKLQKAYAYLGNVVEKKQCIPFRRFNGGVGRTQQAKEFKTTQGKLFLSPGGLG